MFGHFTTLYMKGLKIIDKNLILLTFIDHQAILKTAFKDFLKT